MTWLRETWMIIDCWIVRALYASEHHGWICARHSNA